MYATALLFASAALASAIPATSAPYTVPSFDCAAARDACTARGTEASYCEKLFTDCEGCQSREEALNHTAVPGVSGTNYVQECYWKAVNNGGVTINGDYGCKAFFTTCKDQKDENNSYCASQAAACASCATQENECRNKPEANQSYCSSEASQCVAQNVLA